ncbi:S8 family peptidase [Bacillus tianshenii]|uniref:S8 family serine peptidase n=1 Tax=Sutcliffiella tianshenii TaxID=1463404 RepID=UPI001CD2DB4D|nr:S8 family serine peptidase [Bacillus tianshenii]MCA1319572.1 S8 family peptidase [Bacillus tianshenii]
MDKEQVVEPTWMRLGFPEAPDLMESGKGIGIVILDDIIPHELVQHLGDRLMRVKVAEDFRVTCENINRMEPQPMNAAVEHGMMTLQLLSHMPNQLTRHSHIGLVPAATFIMLAEYEPEKIEAGLKWILEKQEKWNIQILLNLLVPNTREMGTMKPTSKDLLVLAMQPALQAGLLVIAANGNTRVHNNLHPADFLVVGGYDDNGYSNPSLHNAHPAVPWGLNADGDLRPDILAPFSFLPVPYCEENASNRVFSYFGGSCGAASLVAGVCAHLLSKYPEMDIPYMKRLLLQHGEYLHNGDIPVPKLNVAKAVEQYLNGIEGADSSKPFTSNETMEAIMRATSLTEWIERDKITREELWKHLDDESPVVHKTVICYGLRTPKNEMERKKYWDHFHEGKGDSGVRLAWLYQLLMDAPPGELNLWMELLNEKDLEITLCVKIYLEMNFREAPEIPYLPDPDPEYISMATEPVREWYVKN